ncbi:MAG TPA: ThiF family adenylyltransferase [Thiobacillus sp.]
MSPKQAALNSDIKRLLDEGYEVDIRNGYLLVHSVPYVNDQCLVLVGTVVTDLNENVGELHPPKDHQVWFAGEYPCHHTGVPIEAIRHTSNLQPLWQGFHVQHRFSNKPMGFANYPDYYSKMKAYIEIISNEAKVIDPTATPCTYKVIPPIAEDSVFNYHDSASSRADILAISMKLAMNRVAIVGLGGTGSYVLDFVSKTPVREIHLFDGDTFLQHNAFRAPGAASKEILAEKLPKSIYYTRVYEAMHRGIVPHDAYLTDENIRQLAGFDFVFLCVDRGPVRKLISNFLQAEQIPFVDVGMELQMGPEAQNLIGTCRVTMCTPEKFDHFTRHAPIADDAAEDLYRKNIQVADMNAMNAALAVGKWKRYCNFYQDLFHVHHTTYSINSQSLTRDEMVGILDE